MTDRAGAVLPTALALVTAVRTGPDEVAAVLARADLHALAVTLAAMVPDDQPVTALLAWLDQPDGIGDAQARAEQMQLRHGRPVKPTPPPRVVKPCGTHSAYVRHKARAEPVDELCVKAQRMYDAERSRIARDRARVGVA